MSELIIERGVAEGRKLLPAPHVILIEALGNEAEDRKYIQIYKPATPSNSVMKGKVTVVGESVCDDIQLNDTAYIRKKDLEYQHNHIRIQEKMYYLVHEKDVMFLRREVKKK